MLVSLWKGERFFDISHLGLLLLCCLEGKARAEAVVGVESGSAPGVRKACPEPTAMRSNREVFKL